MFFKLCSRAPTISKFSSYRLFSTISFTLMLFVSNGIGGWLLYVPLGSRNKYANVENWKELKNIREQEEKNFDSFSDLKTFLFQLHKP